MLLKRVDIEGAGWFHFLSRWSFVAGVLGVLVLIVFGVVVLPASDHSPLPPAYAGRDYMELALAVSSALQYRLFVTADTLVWVAEAVFLIVLAAILARRTPIRAALVAACALSGLLGLAGAANRAGIATLGAEYAAASAQRQAEILTAYHILTLVATSYFSIGALLWGLGALLAVRAAWLGAAFPRWLVIGLGVQGGIMLAKQIVELVLGLDLGAVFFPAFLLEICVFFGFAWVFWRSVPAVDQVRALTREPSA